MSNLSDTVTVGRAIERWALESWANRGWEPSEEETARLADLRQSDHGQILMRLLDQSSINVMHTLLLRGAPTGGGPDRLATPPTSLEELAYRQGQYEAFQRVMDWLLVERDELLEHEDLTQTTLTEDDDDA